MLANIEARQRIATEQAAINEMSATNDAMTDDIRRLREDPAAVEELARDELGLIKDGELLIIMRDTPSVSPSTTDSRSTASHPR